MDKLNLVPIEYIGKKREKSDTVTGSGITWHGPGDVQPVPPNIAVRLLEPRYADIWRLGPGFGLAAPVALAVAPSEPAANQRAARAKTSANGSSETPPPPPPARAPADELPLVISAIGDLLSGDDAAAHLEEATGLPKCESIAKVLGREVTPAERDAAWAEVMKGAEPPAS